MTHIIWFVFAALAAVASGVLAIAGAGLWAAVCAAVSLLCMLMIYSSISLQMRTIRNGMDLLRSQDFASCLRPVGQAEADEMVVLYNTLMSNMKAERLKNLEQNDFLRKLIDASPLGIAICNLDGDIESTNPAFEALRSPQMLETLAALPQEGGECTLRTGGVQVLRCSRHYFMDRGFQRPFFLVERLTDEIVRAETAVFHKIVRTMGHEVNNTLGGVISVLETMHDIHAGEAIVAETLDSCRTSCTNLSEFVRGYSEIVKLPEPELRTLDLDTFVSDAIPFLNRICSGNIELCCELKAGGTTVAADAMLLQRVLVNAVKNSAESIGSGTAGRIVLRTAPRRLIVEDNGAGISAEAASRLFTPFFSTKRADRGLGLMLVADILRKHKAAFTLATDEDGLTRLTIDFSA